MAVNPKEQIIIPAKTLNKYWLRNINIQAVDVNGEAHATITLVPYNTETGESAPDQAKTVVINNILSKIQGGDQQLLSAYMGIMAAVQKQIDLED